MRAVLLGVALVAAAGLLAWSAVVVLQQGRETDREQCEASRDGRETFRKVLLFVRRSSIASQPTPDLREQRARFWDEVLALAPPIVCEDTGAPKPQETNGKGG